MRSARAAGRLQQRARRVAARASSGRAGRSALGAPSRDAQAPAPGCGGRGLGSRGPARGNAPGPARTALRGPGGTEMLPLGARGATTPARPPAFAGPGDAGGVPGAGSHFYRPPAPRVLLARAQETHAFKSLPVPRLPQGVSEQFQALSFLVDNGGAPLLAMSALYN